MGALDKNDDFDRRTRQVDRVATIGCILAPPAIALSAAFAIDECKGNDDGTREDETEDVAATEFPLTVDEVVGTINSAGTRPDLTARVVEIDSSRDDMRDRMRLLVVDENLCDKPGADKALLVEYRRDVEDGQVELQASRKCEDTRYQNDYPGSFVTLDGPAAVRVIAASESYLRE